MSTDTELHAWQRQWREQSLPATTADDLARSVRKGTSLARNWTIAAAVLTVVMLVPLLQRTLSGSANPRFVIGVLLFVVLVWSSTMWLARGTWRPRDESTAAFLDVSIKRCRAAMVGAPVGIVIYAAELLYVLLSVHRLEGVEWGTLLRSAPVVLIGWIGAPLYVASQIWYARRQRARLRRLQELQAQLAAA